MRSSCLRWAGPGWPVWPDDAWDVSRSSFAAPYARGNRDAGSVCLQRRGIAFRRNGLSQCLGRCTGRHLYQLGVQVHLDIGGAVHARDGLADMAGTMIAGHIGYEKLHDALLLV